MVMIKKYIHIFTCLIITFPWAVSIAQEKNQYSSSHLTEEELSDILKKGNVLSLESIIARLKKQPNDRLLEVELLNYDVRLVYKIEILKTDGVVVNYFLDAETGQDVTKLLE